MPPPQPLILRTSSLISNRVMFEEHEEDFTEKTPQKKNMMKEPLPTTAQKKYELRGGTSFMAPEDRHES